MSAPNSKNGGNKMKKTIIMTTGIVIGSLIIGSIAAFGVVGAKDTQNVQEAENKNTIFVTGVGTVTAKPDKFIVDLTITTTDKSARQAQQQNDSKANALIEALKKIGCKEDDLETIGYYLNPVYKYFPEDNESRLVGYQASYTLKVTAYDLKKIGEIIDKGTENGVNQIGSINYTVKNEADFYAEALKTAMRDAKSKADTALGEYSLKVLSVKNINIAGYQPYITNKSMAPSEDSRGGGAGGVSPNIISGNYSITVNVNVEFNY